MSHEKYAVKMGRALQKIQGRVEWWNGADGNWLYNRDSKRWIKARLTVA